MQKETDLIKAYSFRCLTSKFVPENFTEQFWNFCHLIEKTMKYLWTSVTWTYTGGLEGRVRQILGMHLQAQFQFDLKFVARCT